MNREKSDRKKINVLVVDDDPDLLEVMQFVLESEGFTVETATHGEEALARLRAPGKLPSLVLLDMMMPTMDGPKLLGEVAKIPSLEGLPIVMLTASGPIEGPGAAAVLCKPIDLALLIETVERQAREG